MFGFTGTPIFADNAVGMRTTRDLADAVVATMLQKPGILARRGAIERVIAGIEAIIATFDQDVGDIDD